MLSGLASVVVGRTGNPSAHACRRLPQSLGLACKAVVVEMREALFLAPSFLCFQRARASSRSALPVASCSSMKLLKACRSFARSVAIGFCSQGLNLTGKRAERPPKRHLLRGALE